MIHLPVLPRSNSILGRKVEQEYVIICSLFVQLILICMSGKKILVRDYGGFQMFRSSDCLEGTRRSAAKFVCVPQSGGAICTGLGKELNEILLVAIHSARSH